jgi:hypothetical protein
LPRPASQAKEAQEAMSSHADRQRVYKRRRRDGLVVLPIAVSEYDLIDALITSGRLGEIDGRRRSREVRGAETRTG